MKGKGRLYSATVKAGRDKVKAADLGEKSPPQFRITISLLLSMSIAFMHGNKRVVERMLSSKSYCQTDIAYTGQYRIVERLARPPDETDELAELKWSKPKRDGRRVQYRPPLFFGTKFWLRQASNPIRTLCRRLFGCASRLLVEVVRTMQTQQLKKATVTVTMPDGTEAKMVAVAKTFSTGRHGYYVRIEPFEADGKTYGGQLQLWEKN